MTYYHAFLRLPGGGNKTIPNKDELKMLTEVVIPFVRHQTVAFRRAGTKSDLQVLEINIRGTKDPWGRKLGIPLDQHTKNKKNRFAWFEKKAREILEPTSYRAFVIMPIQGDDYGDMRQQMIKKTFDNRFDIILDLLGEYNCTAIRIDKEMHLGNLVQEIKKEIRRSDFIIVDLTDERPSCYFEAGYADASDKKVIYIAGKESVLTEGAETKIHFDIHNNVQFFGNDQEMIKKIKAVIDKKKNELMPSHA